MKYKHLLTDEFFEINQKNEKSAQNIAHFSILIMDSEVREQMNKLATDLLPSERITLAQEEANSIAQLNNKEDILRFMRKKQDSLNSHLFMEKLCEYEDEIGTEVLRMIKRSGNTSFIEVTTKFLSKCQKDYSTELIAAFDEIRNVYAQSMMFVVIGFRGDEEAIPWVYDKYLKSKYNEKMLANGALVALYELSYRFYEQE